MYGFGRRRLVRRILLPAALPGLFTGLRSGMSLAWMFLVAAELIAAKGLGYLLSDGRETSRPDIVLAAIIVLAVLGKLSDGMLAGLEKDFEGHLLSHTEQLAFVFQEARLMPWLTVQQNIGFSDDDDYDKAWVAQLIEEVGLTGFADALSKALSGGMAQRVAIARGLYSRPRVLLLDEPISAVDAFTRMKLQDLLVQLAERHGIALLLVTHDVDEALYLSDRVLVNVLT